MPTTPSRFFGTHLPRCLLAAVLLAPWALYLIKQPQGGALAAPGGSQDLRIATFNTEYWHSSERELVDQLHYQDMDVVLLQEHLEQRGDDYFPTNRIAQLQQVLKDRFVDHHGEVVTISKWPIVASEQFTNGEALRSDLRLPDGKIISAYNMHLPVHLHLKLLFSPWDFLADAAIVARRRESLLREVIADITTNPNPIIIGGDFNTSIAMRGTHWFREHLTDTYAARHCNDQQGTWTLGSLLSWRIDYIFVSRHFVLGDYCIKPLPAISDHSALVTVLGYGTPARTGTLL